MLRSGSLFGSLFGSLVLFLPAVVTLALAAPRPAPEQAGSRTLRIGSMDVTSIQDGELSLDTALLLGMDSTQVDTMLGRHGPITTSVNAFLVRTGKHLVLVDAGGSAGMAPGLGHLLERIRSAGVSPDSIEAVLITHLHGDHLGGLITAEGKRAFPRAQVRVAQAEHDYWMDPALEAKMPEPYRPMLRSLKATLAPYQAEGAYRPFAPEEAPFPGVKAWPAPGHTPGHTVYVFGSGKDALWAMGDIAHFSSVQFQRPDVAVVFDTDAAKAVPSRIDLWRKAAREGAVMAGAHMPFPGLGRVEERGTGFAWVPVGGD